MLSKPIQQGLALLLGILIAVLLITAVLQPALRAAEAQMARHTMLQFEQQRIKRAVDANSRRSVGDLEVLRTGINAQLFAGANVNEAQGALQALLAATVQSSAGLLNSMRLGDTKDLKNGLTAVTIDLTATIPEEQMMALLSALEQAPQTLHIPKLSLQKKATYDDADTQVTIDLRAIGYWRTAPLAAKAAI